MVFLRQKKNENLERFQFGSYYWFPFLGASGENKKRKTLPFAIST